jgi:general secretion pathway protein D
VFLLWRIVLPGVLGLALTANALAQVPPPLPRRALRGDAAQAPPGDAAQAMPGPPPALPASFPTTPERADVRLQFPNAQVADVLNYYELLTGKRVLSDPTVQGPVNIVVNTPVTKSEAITIIEVALTLNGFSLVPVGEDIVKVLGLGKNVRLSGVPIYFDLSLVPYSEASITFLVRLRYLDAQEVASLLQQYIPPGQSSSVVALQKSGTLLITDSATNVRRLVNMITQIDLPVAPVTEKFIRLERADATKAVEFLDSVFDLKGAQTTGGGGTPGTPGSPAARRPIRRVNDEGQPIADMAQVGPILPGQLPLLSGDSIIQGRITLTADVRTNRVHVVTSPLNMPLVEQLITDYDADAPFAEPVRYPLRFVKAKDVLPILVQSLTEPGTENAANGSTGTATPRSSPPPSTNRSNSSTSSGDQSGSGGSGSGASTVGQEELSVEPADTMPEIQTVGNTKIIADPSSNTIILLGGAEANDKVLKIINTLDIRKRQIIIRVLIGELSLENDSEYGLQYLLRHGNSVAGSQYESGFINTAASTTTTDPTTGVTTTTPATTTGSTTLSDLTALASGLPSGFSGLAGIISVTKNFDVIVSALESTTRFKTLNRPVIFTSNSEKATIISGEEIAVPTSSLSTATLGTTTTSNAAISSNVEFKKVALQLEVVPLINSDREVTMDIVQKLDSLVSGQSVTVGGNVIPTIANREIKSTVSMQSGATVVLGGLITESDSKTNNDVPYLSKIPYLGPIFFKARTRTITRSELIILLHPEVVNSPDRILAASVDEQNRTYLGTNLEDQLLPNLPVRKAIAVTPATTTTTTTTTTVRAPGTPPPAK